MTEAQDNVVVKNIRNNPEGIHIYEIPSSPSQNGGLAAINSTSPYFGVFVASLDNNNIFDLEYNYNNVAACNILSRKDNSVASWVSSGSPVKDVLQNGEYIKSLGDKVHLNLGPDLSLCNQVSQTIVSDTTNAAFSYLWNTGQTTPGITVSSSGKYWLKIMGGCNVAVDTVNIKMLISPTFFYLGADEQPCPFSARRLQPYSSSVNLRDWEFTWQDGSKKPYFDAKDYGQYWVKIKNSCGELSDTISFKMPGQEINLNLGSDITSCDKPTIKLETNVQNNTYTYLWNNGATSSEIIVSKSGKYWLRISDGCRIKQDTVNVKISFTPDPILLGENEITCPLVPKRLQFDYSLTDLSFTWQDGTTQSYFDIKEYGNYWVVAKNVCGEAKGEITFSKPELAVDPPNVITPNGDNYNQFFHFDIGKYGSVSLLILNRWGKRVFYTNDYKNTWDGGDLSSGIYFYTIRGECINETKGSVSIIR